MSEQEQNIAIIRRFVDEYLNKRKESTLYELMDPNCMIHGAYTVGKGPEVYKQAMDMILKGLPDCFYRIDDIFAVGDKVVIRGTEGGTHKGEFYGILATGKRVSWMAITIVRMAGGKLVEVWGSRNLLEFVKQVGGVVVPGKQAGE